VVQLGHVLFVAVSSSFSRACGLFGDLSIAIAGYVLGKVKPTQVCSAAGVLAVIISLCGYDAFRHFGQSARTATSAAGDAARVLREIFAWAPGIW
jgi:hypothetical protein